MKYTVIATTKKHILTSNRVVSAIVAICNWVNCRSHLYCLVSGNTRWWGRQHPVPEFARSEVEYWPRGPANGRWLSIVDVRGSKRGEICVIISRRRSAQNEALQKSLALDGIYRLIIFLFLFLCFRLHVGPFITECVGHILLASFPADEVVCAHDFKAEIGEPKLSAPQRLSMINRAL